MKLFKTSQRRKAFTLVEMIVVIGVIAVAVLIFLPPFTTHKRAAVRISCVNNLKQIGLAFRIWEGDNNNRYPMQFYTNQMGGPLFTNAASAFLYFQAMSNELSNPKILKCPDDKQHHSATNFGPDFDRSNISYFVGLDVSEKFPQSFLAGDSHLTNGIKLNDGLMELTTNQSVSWTAARHNGSGNIAMADGSVQSFNTSELQQALQKTGLATNRLLMPPSP